MSGSLIILRGLPASGKSTVAYDYVTEQLQAGNTKVSIVCRDDLRRQAGLTVTPGVYEPTVTLQQHALVKAGLKAGHTVISADTNLRASTVKNLAGIAEHYGAAVEVLDIDTPFEECVKRDRLRGENAGHSVGEDVIRNFHKRYFTKGKFPKNPLERKVEAVTFEPYVPNTMLQKAFIVDIDGTLANIYSPDGTKCRSPYDYTNVSVDWPHKDVIQMIEDLHMLDYKIIGVSGREDSCMSDTLTWLMTHTTLIFSEYDYPHTCPLYMRKAGDTRADYIVKNEIFDAHIRDRYNVVGIFDDRKQVIDGWRTRNIRVYDVAGNTF